MMWSRLGTVLSVLRLTFNCSGRRGGTGAIGVGAGGALRRKASHVVALDQLCWPLVPARVAVCLQLLSFCQKRPFSLERRASPVPLPAELCPCCAEGGSLMRNDEGTGATKACCGMVVLLVMTKGLVRVWSSTVPPRRSCSSLSCSAELI
jgi:hypothetical protein